MSILLLTLALASAAVADPAHSPDGQGEPFAWFIANDATGPVIRYCVHAKAQSEKAEIEKLVDEAVIKWSDYHEMIFMDDNTLIHRTAGMPDEILFRGRTELRAKCRGDEDLTVYYGVEDSRVNAARAMYDDPLGFAHLESFDEKTGAARGILWLSDAPEIRMHRNHRRALITHEIGHTFGVPHVEGTIMDANLAAKITGAYRAGKPFDPRERRKISATEFPWINLERELRGWTEIEFGYYHNLVVIAAGKEPDQATQALTGQTLSGGYEIGFQRLVGPLPRVVNHDWEIMGNGRLILCAGGCDKPGQPSYEFRAEYGTPFRLPLGDQKLFRRIYRGQEQFLPRQALLFPGVFIDAKGGRRTEFLMSRNGDEAIELYVVVDGVRHRLL